MKKYFIYIIIVLIGFTVSNCYSSNLEMANKIIVKIEDYRAKNSVLPNSLNEIGIIQTEEGPIYYEKKDSLNYILWLQSNSLGDSKVYYSDSKKWENGYREISKATH